MAQQEKLKLNTKQLMFIDKYLTTFNATSAAKEAGYSQKTSYSIGSRLLKHVEIAKEINSRLDDTHQQQKRIMIQAADDAVSALIDVIRTGRGLARVNAANSILDRSGHKPIERVEAELNHSAMNELSDQKIKEAILDAAESFAAPIGGAGGQ